MLGGAAALSLAGRADAESDPLPSWNAGPAKDAIVAFVHATTDAASPDFVPLAERIATFDQDGTLWVEHPIYTQLVYCFDHVPALVKAKPGLAKVEPFRTVLTGDREAMARLGLEPLLKIVAATLSGMDVDTFRDEVAKWDRGSARSTLEAAVHRSRLRAANRASRLPARQWLQDLHRDRRRPGFRAHICGARLRRPA
jgi:hypothetical protein